MDDEAIKEAKKRLLDINKTIESLDPSIRAAAFELLAPLYFEEIPEADERVGAKKDRKPSHSSEDQEKFFSEHDHEKASDNVHLIVAWYYSQYGVTPLTHKEISETAGDVGLTIPDRSDNTMRQAKSDGKQMYRKKGNGWQLTVHGESYIKKQYNVKKGNKQRTTENET